ncbi:MAG: phosphate/phosphite/phosphonate ABC transporter substrate-binding protein [Candidatus Lumbricidophila eiseniae]|uniref:Phosphate/phosphite/phosphonate ABC transporter substrate-binding protein n=1 Tax=Candidatus Lumbricidiphila eiseniae TaxID=1969409 RepID=A0A2A6FMY9_9MICO|nr:MAG: phosphate/phosphite/phosphonate ABC transporter substrate-binding protein [Candidatus Lumbricidophila eiseniae]
MKLPSHGLITGVVAVLTVIALTGCSGTPNSTGSPATSTGRFAVDSHTLVFGVVPDSAATQTNYQPLMDYLAKVTGKKVTYQQSTDYAALIEAAVAGKIDVASFSGFTYVTAKKNGAAITPISSIITKQGQEPGYYSEAIVPANSTITDISGFKNKKVCFVSPTSTSGYLFPSYSLLNAGIDPAQEVTPVFAGKHDVSVAKVAAGGECDAGFAEDSEADPAAAAGKIRIIAKTMVPGAPITISDTLPQATKDSVIKALSTVTIDQIIAAGITSANTDGFKSVFHATSPVTDNYYDTVRDICKKTNAKQCQ